MGVEISFVQNPCEGVSVTLRHTTTLQISTSRHTFCTKFQPLVFLSVTGERCRASASPLASPLGSCNPLNFSYWQLSPLEIQITYSDNKFQVTDSNSRRLSTRWYSH